MKNVLITGPFCDRKEQILEHIHKERDLKKVALSTSPRQWMIKKNNITNQEEYKTDIDNFETASYIGAFIMAQRNNIRAVLDGSLIENLAYSLDTISKDKLELIHEYLLQYKQNSIAYVLPPSYIYDAHKYDIHGKIMNIIEYYGIEHILAKDISPKEHAKQILSIIDTNKYD